MIALLAAAMLVLVTPNGQMAPWFANHPSGPRVHAERLAEMYIEAADRHGLDVHLLVALGYKESALNSAAVSPIGAFGLAQLHRRWHADVWNTCQSRVALCDWLVIDRGAQVLAWNIRRCNGDSRGVTGYRHGRCRPSTPETRAVIALRRWLTKRTQGAV